MKLSWSLNEVENILCCCSLQGGSLWVVRRSESAKPHLTTRINRQIWLLETNWATDTTTQSQSRIYPPAAAAAAEGFQFLNGLTIDITSCAGREIVLIFKKYKKIKSHLISGWNAALLVVIHHAGLDHRALHYLWAEWRAGLPADQEKGTPLIWQ